MLVVDLDYIKCEICGKDVHRDYTCSYWNGTNCAGDPWHPSIELIKQFQKEAWNEALDWAVSKVYPMMLSDMDEIHSERIKQSILDGKL
jgi:hypothetical protein